MKLIIIRGLPGSGKTTLAKKIAATGFVHYENDMYLEDMSKKSGKTYQETISIRENLVSAYETCMSDCRLSLFNKEDVVVSNTFTTKKELKPYLDMAEKFGADLEVITMSEQYESIHDVPDYVISRMKARWEELDR